MVQLESFIASHGLIAPEVREDDCDVYEKLAPSLQALLRANRDVHIHNRSSPDPDALVSVDSIGDLSVSPCQSRADGLPDSAHAILPMENSNGNIQAQEVADITNENRGMDDWLADIINTTDGPVFSGEGDRFQAPPLDWDNVPGAQPVPDLLNEIEQLSPTVPNHRLNVTKASFNAEPNTASCYHDSSEDDDELVLQLSNRMGDFHLTKDGMSRFYGATSNFNFARWRSSSGVDHRQNVVEQAELEHNESEDADMSTEKSLEELYFCWQDTAFHAIDQDMYQHGKKLWREQRKASTFYSPFLTNAM